MAPSMYSTLVNQVKEKMSIPTSQGLPFVGSSISSDLPKPKREDASGLPIV
jgi:hypothetical protein